MPKQFAVLGWGSLLWDDAHHEFNAQIGAWQYNGPTLPIEFSRISQTRDDALTLVLDSAHGASVVVAWPLSTRNGLAPVIEDLRLREGTLFMANKTTPDFLS
jgi:hypothetical protein